jgi:hypothetical protein
LQNIIKYDKFEFVQHKDSLMSKKDKLIRRIKSSPRDFTWNELVTLMNNLGFEEISTGKTGGSRRKFYCNDNGLIINLHKPHPSSTLKSYAIEQVIEKLEEEGII